jgi:cytochrome c-type biogenesis protein CcmI
MGLIMGIVTLPLAPVRGVVWIAEQIQHEAERQHHDPSRLRAALHDLDAKRQFGLIDEAEADRLEEELIDRLLAADDTHFPEA